MEFFGAGRLEESDEMEEFEFFDTEDDLDVDFYEPPVKEESKKRSSALRLLFSILCTIAEQKGLVPSMPSKLSIAATAVGAITGSLLGGPPGLAVGLLTGAVAAIRTSPKRSREGKRDSKQRTVREIFTQMSLEEKKELIRELLRGFKQAKVKCLIFDMMKNESVRNLAMEILSGFLKEKLGISLMNPL